MNSFFVNAFRSKRGREGNSPYKVMFSASRNGLSLQSVTKDEAFVSNDKEFHHVSDCSSRFTEVLAIQLWRGKRFSLDLLMPINSYSIEGQTLQRKLPHDNKAALKTRWTGSCKPYWYEEQYIGYRIKNEEGRVPVSMYSGSNHLSITCSVFPEV